MSGPERFRAALKPVLDVFEDLGVPWCVTGSSASVHFGVPRSTIDVDLVAEIRPAHVRRFCAALSPDYYAAEEAIAGAVLRGGSFNVIHVGTAVKIDVFPLGATPYARESFRRRRMEELTLLGPCYVPSPEDVILAKLLWYEAGGRESERQWSDVRGLVRTQGDSLDREYLVLWAQDQGIRDLLEAALALPPDPTGAGGTMA